MLVANNSFDLWQKDTFFSAAEEVQTSADIMESAYRTWVRQRREGLTPQDLDELCRELQTSLGTAKWQLDEFQRAVRMSYRNRADDITATRHRQFVVAIESQISCVETELREYFNEEGKKPLRWINLDEEERDDLAMFLSGTPGNLETVKDDFPKLGAKTQFAHPDKQFIRKDSDFNSKDVVNSNVEGSYVIDVEPNEVPGTSDDSTGQSDRKANTRRTWNLPRKDEQKKPSMLDIKETSKDKGSKPSVWKSRCGNHPQAKGVISSYTQLRGNNWINQFFSQAAGSQRQLQSSIHLQRSFSFRLMLALMLTVFFIVPFVLYSN